MFTTRITPRVSETDGARHINNTVVPVWLEAGRKEVFRLLSPDLAFDNWHVALVNTNVDYLAQIFWQHDVEVRTWVERVGTKSFTLYEEIWQRESLCVRATVTYVYFDYRAGQSLPVPDDVRAQLLAHQRNSG